MEVDTPTAMEKPPILAILIVPGKTAKAISFHDGKIFAEQPEDQESWNGTVTEAKRNEAIIDEMHIKFNCEWKTVTMRRLGQQLYRSEDKTHMILYGDMQNPITMRAPATDYVGMPDFYCLMTFQYFHPCRDESSLRIGYVGVEKKISWNHRAPTGYWSLSPLMMTEEELEPYPKGLVYKNVLEIKFHCKGIEAKAKTTLYVLVQGAKNVWRAAGRRLKCGKYVLDPEDDLEQNKGWSIVLVAAEELNFNVHA